MNLAGCHIIIAVVNYDQYSVVRVTTEAPTDSDTGHCRRQAVSDSHAVKFSSIRLWAALECVICMVNEVLSVAHSYFWK